MYYVWSIYRQGNEICSIGYKLFEIEILADSYPDETHWALQSTDGKFQWDTLEQNSDIYFEYPANIKTIQEICLDATKDYTFTIFDDSKDGIESPGYYAIRYGGVQLKRNSAFGQKDVTSFSGGSKSPTPKPTTKPPTTKPTAKPPTPKPTTKTTPHKTTYTKTNHTTTCIGSAIIGSVWNASNTSQKAKTPGPTPTFLTCNLRCMWNRDSGHLLP
jgi:hypothetical protein